MSIGIGGHQSPYRGATDEWLTPPDLRRQLGDFDLDPCSPVSRPWDTAASHYTIQDNGLALPWKGRIWLNPPYGPQTNVWLKKLAMHGNGMALIFARTETDMFFKWVWEKAHAVLFLRGRLYFHRLDGSRAASNSGAPSCLIGYGFEMVQRLTALAELGQLIVLRNPEPNLSVSSSVNSVSSVVNEGI